MRLLIALTALFVMSGCAHVNIENAEKVTKSAKGVALDKGQDYANSSLKVRALCLSIGAIGEKFESLEKKRRFNELCKLFKVKTEIHLP